MHKINTVLFLVIICSGFVHSRTKVQITDTLIGTPLQSKFLYVGLSAGFNSIWNETELPVIPGSNDCGSFTKGNDFGYYLGFEGEYEFLPNTLNFILRFLFDHRPVTLSEKTDSYEVFDETSRNYVPLIRGHNFNGSLDYLLLEGGISYRLPIKFPIFIKLTADAGNPIFGTEFENSEEIINPDNILFPEMRRKRIVESGKITNAGSSYGVSFGVGTEFLLNNGFYIKPEIRFRYAMNSVISDYEWHTNILRFGLQISRKLDLGEKQKIIRSRTIYLPDPPKPEPPVEAEMPVLIKNFISEPLNYLETTVTQTYPLLNYVFFDSASSAIIDKYVNKSNIDNFNEEFLSKETLSIYYNLFDIIGSRLKANPDARIKLTGVTDGEELPSQKDRMKLAGSRAKNVADYIINRWKIDEKRISIEVSDMPTLPTSREYPEGYQENRRVEITSNNTSILKPVVHSKFYEYTSTQELIQFDFELNHTTELTEWSLSALDGLIKSEGKLTPEESASIKISFPLTKEIINFIGNKNDKKLPLKAKLTVNSKDKGQEVKEIDFNLTKETNSFEIGRLNLIVFDFDKSDISQQNKLMIDDFIKNSIKENSTVSIKGSTDRLGELKYNYKLSTDRANTVRNYIKSFNSSAKIVDVIGIGPSILPYDNNLPEGRFYCRTVLIEVQTPLK